MARAERLEEIKQYLKDRREELYASPEASITAWMQKVRRTGSGKKRSYGEIGRSARIDESYVAKIGRGERRPAKYVWFRIGLACGCGPEEMAEFMRAGGYALNEWEAADALLLRAVELNMSVDELWDVFEELTHVEELRELGIHEESMDKIFDN